MVFTALLQKIGLLDVLAPHSATKRRERKRNDERERLAQREEELARLAEERRRDAAVEDRVRTQRAAEGAAAAKDRFVRNQRVEYVASDERRYRAVVVGVHFDDDPERPYYTIKYKRFEENVNSDDGSPATNNIIEVEKQTNPERLTRVPWDEAKMRELLR